MNHTVVEGRGRRDGRERTAGKKIDAMWGDKLLRGGEKN